MLNLQQTQRLQQKLSPQQIQYIQLLQLPTLALEQRIEAELEENPLLEDATTEAVELAEDMAEEPVEAESERDPDEEYDWGELLDNTEDMYGYKARVDYSREEDRELPLPATGTLIEHLRDQLALQDLTEEEEIIAEQIIGSIDEDGYLRRPLESIVDDLSFNAGFTPELSDIEDMLVRIQRLGSDRDRRPRPPGMPAGAAPRHAPHRSRPRRSHPHACGNVQGVHHEAFRRDPEEVARFRRRASGSVRSDPSPARSQTRRGPVFPPGRITSPRISRWNPSTTSSSSRSTDAMRRRCTSRGSTGRCSGI